MLFNSLHSHYYGKHAEMYFILRHMQYAICNMQYISTSSTMEYLSTLTCNPNYSLQNHVNGPVFKNPTVPELYFIMLLLPKKKRIYTTRIYTLLAGSTERCSGWSTCSECQVESKRRHYRGDTTEAPPSDGQMGAERSHPGERAET